MTGWRILRVKRAWIPEWLWRALGQSVLRQPLRKITTRDLHADEVLDAWSGEGIYEDGQP